MKNSIKITSVAITLFLLSLAVYSEDYSEFSTIEVGQSGYSVFAKVIQIVDDKSILADAPDRVGKWIIKINEIDAKNFVDGQILKKMLLKRTGIYKYRDTAGIEKRIMEFSFISYLDTEVKSKAKPKEDDAKKKIIEEYNKFK